MCVHIFISNEKLYIYLKFKIVRIFLLFKYFSSSFFFFCIMLNKKKSISKSYLLFHLLRLRDEN